MTTGIDTDIGAKQIEEIDLKNHFRMGAFFYECYLNILSAFIICR